MSKVSPVNTIPAGGPDRRRNTTYDQVVLWLLLAGVVCAGVVVSYDYGFLTYMYVADTSRITVLITILFVGFSIYCLATIVQFSRELNVAEEVSRRLDRGETASTLGRVAQVGDYRLPEGWVGRHIADVLLKRSLDASARPGVLLDSYISRFRGRTRFGIYGADVLYKLGMLGTVIGFIQMLATMDGMVQFDASSLQLTLQQMTGGMATALLTTIAGLVCGLVLRVEFNMLEAVAANVITETTRIGDIYLAPGAADHVRS